MGACPQAPLKPGMADRMRGRDAQEGKAMLLGQRDFTA
jgi:hypothetical protein